MQNDMHNVVLRSIMMPFESTEVLSDAADGPSVDEITVNHCHCGEGRLFDVAAAVLVDELCARQAPGV